MLTEIYIEALLVDPEAADQVWEAWNRGGISVLCPHEAAAIPLIHRYLRHVMRFTQSVALTD